MKYDLEHYGQYLTECETRQNTIDKYLIDADMLFRNLADIKELEADVSYLSPVQLKIIAFWANFTDETSLSEEKRRFLYRPLAIHLYKVVHVIQMHLQQVC